MPAPERWSGRVSLTPRILAVNVFALALLAGGFFYLDSYRTRIVDDRLVQSARESEDLRVKHACLFVPASLESCVTLAF